MSAGDFDLESADEEALCERLHALDEQKQAIRAEQLAIHRRIEVVRARQQLLALPEGQQAALAQAVRLAGIPSDEAFS